MATPSTGADSARSRLPSSTKGGASAEPTPANNAGGGSGWGDAGFTKGGTDGDGGGFRGYEGTGHGMAENLRSTIGGFSGLEAQKGAAERNFRERFDEAAGRTAPTTDQGAPTCESEDHSFMEHKPGCSKTLPGWDTAKSVAQGLTGQGSQ